MPNTLFYVSGCAVQMLSEQVYLCSLVKEVLAVNMMIRIITKGKVLLIQILKAHFEARTVGVCSCRDDIIPTEATEFQDQSLLWSFSMGALSCVCLHLSKVFTFHFSLFSLALYLHD